MFVPFILVFAVVALPTSIFAIKVKRFIDSVIENNRESTMRSQAMLAATRARAR